MSKYTVVATVLAVIATSARADPPNAAAIVKSCVPPTSECQTYVNGFMDGVMFEQIEREHGTPICIPDGTTTDQLREVIVRFILAHQQILIFPGNAAVASALAETYPCGKLR